MNTEIKKKAIILHTIGSAVTLIYLKIIFNFVHEHKRGNHVIASVCVCVSCASMFITEINVDGIFLFLPKKKRTNHYTSPHDPFIL